VLADLQGAVAVDLGDGDLRQAVAVEERQQVIAELPRVVGERGLLEFVTARLEPLRRELVEGRGGRRLGGVGDAWRPQAALDVGQDVAQLGLGLLTRPAVLCAAQRDEVPAPVSAETQPKTRPLLRSRWMTSPVAGFAIGSSYCVSRVCLDRAGPIGSRGTTAAMRLEGGDAGIGPLRA
jgi:hypothetical protein